MAKLMILTEMSRPEFSDSEPDTADSGHTFMESVSQTPGLALQACPDVSRHGRDI